MCETHTGAVRCYTLQFIATRMYTKTPTLTLISCVLTEPRLQHASLGLIIPVRPEPTAVVGEWGCSCSEGSAQREGNERTCDTVRHHPQTLSRVFPAVRTDIL